MNGYDRRKQRKKEQIRTAVFELLNEVGSDRMTIGQIAKKANVSQVTIYNHFKNKDELIRDVICHYLWKEHEAFAEMMRSERPFEEKIEWMIFRKMQTLERLNEDVLSLLLDKDGEIRRFWNDLYQHHSLPLFIDMIRSAQKKGEVDARLSIESVLFYIQAFKQAADAYPAAYFTERKDSLIRDITHLFFYGLRGQTDSA